MHRHMRRWKSERPIRPGAQTVLALWTRVDGSANSRPKCSVLSASAGATHTHICMPAFPLTHKGTPCRRHN
eukprot:4014431-Alexandrium_andersonii.AAC.1